MCANLYLKCFWTLKMYSGFCEQEGDLNRNCFDCFPRRWSYYYSLDCTSNPFPKLRIWMECVEISRQQLFSTVCIFKCSADFYRTFFVYCFCLPTLFLLNERPVMLLSLVGFASAVYCEYLFVGQLCLYELSKLTIPLWTTPVAIVALRDCQNTVNFPFIFFLRLAIYPQLQGPETIFSVSQSVLKMLLIGTCQTEVAISHTVRCERWNVSLKY